MTNQLQPETARPQPTLATVIEALKAIDSGNIAYTTIFYGLSNLRDTDIAQLKSVWEGLDAAYRRKLMREMIDLSEQNFDMDYRAIGLLSLSDDDNSIRTTAIDVLWEDDSLETMSRFIEMVQWDESHEVRAAAASALGRFILMGELGELPENETVKAQEAVLNLWSNVDEDIEVRRRALEALANCSHSIIPDAIREAYESPEQPLRVSALFAMGRTCDNRWEDIVLREIDSSDPEIRYEAARSSGELELASALPKLSRLALEADYEIKEVAIWSLGEIGGKEALRVLEYLAEEAYDSENDELLDAIEEAIANASLAGGDLPFLFDIDSDLEDDLDGTTDIDD